MKKLIKLSMLTAMAAVVMVMTMAPSSIPTDPNRCPAYWPGYTVLLPNPEDCRSFFSCSNGVPILMHCPDGLYFDSKLGVCDWPANVLCYGGNGPGIGIGSGIDKDICFKVVITNDDGHYVLKCAKGTTDRHLEECPEDTIEGTGYVQAECYTPTP